MPPDLTNDLTIYHQLIKHSNYIKLTLDSAESLDQTTAVPRRRPHPPQTGGGLSQKVTNRPLAGRSKRSGARFCSYDSRLWACRVDRDFSPTIARNSSFPAVCGIFPTFPTASRPPSRISASAPDCRWGLWRGTKRNSHRMWRSEAGCALLSDVAITFTCDHSVRN